MSDRLGPLSFGKRDELVFLGREIGEQRNYSDEIAKTIDEEVRAIVDRAYERASQVLEVHRDRLDALAHEADRRGDRRPRGFETLFSDLPPKEDLHGLPPRPPPAGGRAGRGARAGRQGRRQAEVLARPEPGMTARRHPSRHSIDCARPPAGRFRFPARYRFRHEPPTGYHAPVTIRSTPASRRSSRPRKDARLESYFELLRIPSISTLPEHAPDMRPRRRVDRRRADAGSGSSTSRSRRRAGHPIVYADWLHAEGAPTILVYCHYDVQPVDPIELWETAPFDPFVRDGRDGRARRGRRQGPAAHAPQGRRGDPRDARQAAAEPAVPVRGRGGALLGRPAEAGSRRTGTGSRPTRS